MKENDQNLRTSGERVKETAKSCRIPVRVTRTEFTCPNIEDHTLCPEGYLQWHAWAEEMSKTHRQRKCAGCGRYAVWEREAARRQEGSE